MGLTGIIITIGIVFLIIVLAMTTEIGGKILAGFSTLVGVIFILCVALIFDFKFWVIVGLATIIYLLI